MGYLLYGSRYNWWLSSPSASDTTNFCNVNNNGNANNNDARNSNGVAPDFVRVIKKVCKPFYSQRKGVDNPPGKGK